jgi:hypothetical protein
MNKNQKQKKEIFICNFLLKNRRGNLLPEETLKIIIAVICIIFLVILVSSIYFALSGSENAKYAEASKILISSEVTRINNGGISNPSGLLVPNPSGWSIFSFVSNDPKPNLCTGENCLCICERLAIGIINVDSRIAQKCDDKGACVVIPTLEKFGEIKIENAGAFISVQKINNAIQITKK